MPLKGAPDAFNETNQEHHACQSPAENEPELEKENYLPKEKISEQNSSANAALPINTKRQSSAK